MQKKRFICKECGHTFEAETYTREESEKMNIQLIPIRCPHCSSVEVEESKKYY